MTCLNVAPDHLLGDLRVHTGIWPCLSNSAWPHPVMLEVRKIPTSGSEIWLSWRVNGGVASGFSAITATGRTRATGSLEKAVLGRSVKLWLGHLGRARRHSLVEGVRSRVKPSRATSKRSLCDPLRIKMLQKRHTLPRSHGIECCWQLWHSRSASDVAAVYTIAYGPECIIASQARPTCSAYQHLSFTKHT